MIHRKKTFVFGNMPNQHNSVNIMDAIKKVKITFRRNLTHEANPEGNKPVQIPFVKGREFQSFFAKGCVLLYISMALWRFCFERKVEDLARDWPRYAAGNIALAISWVFFLVYSWREKYD